MSRAQDGNGPPPIGLKPRYMKRPSMVMDIIGYLYVDFGMISTLGLLYMNIERELIIMHRVVPYHKPFILYYIAKIVIFFLPCNPLFPCIFALVRVLYE